MSVRRTPATHITYMRMQCTKMYFYLIRDGTLIGEQKSASWPALDTVKVASVAEVFCNINWGTEIFDKIFDQMFQKFKYPIQKMWHLVLV